MWVLENVVPIHPVRERCAPLTPTAAPIPSLPRMPPRISTPTQGRPHKTQNVTDATRLSGGQYTCVALLEFISIKGSIWPGQIRRSRSPRAIHYAHMETRWPVDSYRMNQSTPRPTLRPTTDVQFYSFISVVRFASIDIRCSNKRVS